MTLEVTRLTISDCLSNLLSGEWQIPKFQREFVWNPSQVFGLLRSIFRSRPVGLITLWEQPQGAPHVEAEPVKLRTTPYKNFDASPAVMKFVLDGRQRLTALAIAFGGLRETDARRGFSGYWFLNLDADPDRDEDEDLIEYKKPADAIAAKLTVPGNALAAGLVPLNLHSRFGEFAGNVHNPDFYPDGLLPPVETRKNRLQRLSTHYETFLKFQVPIAELPRTVSLEQVCDIFDVLNTTGTKVSTFDLIHNYSYAATNGTFDLRAIFASSAGGQPNLGLLCDQSRQEYFCQLVTACYMIADSPPPIAQPSTGKRAVDAPGRNGKPVRTIKGGDLLNTPTRFYEEFADNLQRIDTFCSTLFSPEVLDGRFSIGALPYPASVLIYVALRWAQDRTPAETFPIDHLNRLFRAFFWSNALTGRYDQGFLTRFASDLKEIKSLLVSHRQHGDRLEWASLLNFQLDEMMFKGDAKRLSEDQLTEMLQDGEIRGAKQQAIRLFLLSKARLDLVTGEDLDLQTNDRDKRVHLHHIFPKQWCLDNKASHEVLEDEHSSDSFSNLMPLTAISNNRWKSKAPATAIKSLAIVYGANDPRFSNSFIDDAMFKTLAKPTPDPESFWKERARKIAKALHALQYVSG